MSASSSACLSFATCFFFSAGTMYIGEKSFSTSIPSRAQGLPFSLAGISAAEFGRSRMCPIDASTWKPSGRKAAIVRALAGDSTMTRLFSTRAKRLPSDRGSPSVQNLGLYPMHSEDVKNAAFRARPAIRLGAHLALGAALRLSGDSPGPQASVRGQLAVKDQLVVDEVGVQDLDQVGEDQVRTHAAGLPVVVATLRVDARVVVVNLSVLPGGEVGHPLVGAHAVGERMPAVGVDPHLSVQAARVDRLEIERDRPR